MKKTLLLTGTIFLSSCGTITSYDYPTYIEAVNNTSQNREVSENEFTTTIVETYVLGLKISGEPYDNVKSKLLHYNPDYDFVVNPKIKSKTVTKIPFLFTQKMERITAKLGKYNY